MPQEYREEFYPAGAMGNSEPVLRRQYNDGASPVELTGDRALANSNSPEGQEWRQSHDPMTVGRMLYMYGAEKESTPFAIGQKLKSFAEAKGGNNVLSRTMNQGALPGGLAGAGLGALGGLLAGYITGNSPSKWALIAGLLGGVGGAALGNMRKKTVEGAADSMYDAQRKLSDFENWQYERGYLDDSGLNKSAAMFSDPRNVILEKLQGATDIGFAEKAKLATAVRNLDPVSAQKLADMVRATLGFGVGALISKFIFGTGTTGTLVGGLMGIVGMNLLNSALQTSHPIIPSYSTPTYADLLR